MEKGTYKEKRVDFSKFEVYKFTPFLFPEYCSSLYGCGANILSLLSGLPQNKIKPPIKSRPDHWPDSFIIKFLKERKFEILKITQCSLSNNEDRQIIESLTRYNLILTSQLVLKNECSWYLTWDNYYYHGSSISKLRPFDFLNYPIISAYCLFHKRYR